MAVGETTDATMTVGIIMTEIVDQTEDRHQVRASERDFVLRDIYFQNYHKQGNNELSKFFILWTCHVMSSFDQVVVQNSQIFLRVSILLIHVINGS